MVKAILISFVVGVLVYCSEQDKETNKSSPSSAQKETEKLQKDLADKKQKEESQLVCLAILNEVYEATKTNNMKFLSKLAYERFDVCPGQGTNEGCTHLKMALMNLKKPYEGSRLSDQDFDYAIRKIASAAQLLK